MRVPLVEGTQGRDHHSGLGGLLLEREGIPPFERLRHGIAVMSAFEKGEDAFAVMGKIGVEAHEAAVAARIKAGDLVPSLGRRLTVDAQIALAAKLDRGVTPIDADRLPSP